MKKYMKLIIIILIGILSLSCGYLVKELRKNQIKQDLLTKEKVLVIGKELYEYAASVGHCKIFEYSDTKEPTPIVLNYEVVASHFTDDYITNKNDFKHNVLSDIYKDEDGNYRANSRCGFGLAFSTREVIGFDLNSITEDHITFNVTINAKGYEPITSNLVSDETTVYSFGIKKKNDNWLVDYYDFAYLTNLEIK